MRATTEVIKKVAMVVYRCDQNGEHQEHAWHTSNEMSDAEGEPSFMYYWCPGSLAKAVRR